MSDVKRDRRAAIVAAAYRCMARHGYERTTTAEICTQAGVSSGTFFHYFPTKAAVFVAILEVGLENTREAFQRIRATAVRDAEAALEQWREHVLGEASDPDLVAFLAGLGAAPEHPDAATVLRAEAAVIHETLTEVVAAGQKQGVMRDDRAPDHIALWLDIVARGLLDHAVEENAVSAQELRSGMTDTVARLVRP